MPRPARSVIITGDDFGSSRGVNQAIVEAHRRGVLTSASLMVAGEAFEEAVDLARQNPSMAVGLHLTLVDGRSILSAREIPRLVDREGKFSSNPVTAGWRCQRNPSSARREIRAQLEKFRGTGLNLSHVDGHQHLHLPPVVLKTLGDLAREFGIRAVRLPSEELGLALRVDREGWMQKVHTSAAFGALRWSYARRLLAGAGIRFADRVYGLLQTGRVTEEYLLGLIPQIRADRVEIYSHPTMEPGQLSSKGASRPQWEALVSGRVRAALDAAGFRLSTYAELN